MILMGDEFSRSQGGNNNTWCQDNPIGWMIWGQENCDQELFLFLKKLLSFRKILQEILGSGFLFTEPSTSEKLDHQATWLQWHGTELSKPETGEWSHTISCSINKGAEGGILWVGFNAYKEKINFELPNAINNWHCILNTSKKSSEDLIFTSPAWESKEIELMSHSLLVMTSTHLIPKFKELKNAIN